MVKFLFACFLFWVAFNVWWRPSGKLTRREFKDAVDRLGIPLTNGQMIKLFKSLDPDMSGNLDQEEFDEFIGIVSEDIPPFDESEELAFIAAQEEAERQRIADIEAKKIAKAEAKAARAAAREEAFFKWREAKEKKQISLSTDFFSPEKDNVNISFFIVKTTNSKIKAAADPMEANRVIGQSVEFGVLPGHSLVMLERILRNVYLPMTDPETFTEREPERSDPFKAMSIASERSHVSSVHTAELKVCF